MLHMLHEAEYYQVLNTLTDMMNNGDIVYIADDTYITQETGWRKKFDNNEIVEYVWKLMQE